MNVEIGAEAALFPGKKYISGIFVAVHGRPVRQRVVVLARQAGNRFLGFRLGIDSWAPKRFTNSGPALGHFPYALPGDNFLLACEIFQSL